MPHTAIRLDELHGSFADPSIRGLFCARGPLLGVNLAKILASRGRLGRSTRHAIFFLEAVGETAYAIARMLLALKHAGKFDIVAGVVVGACAHCDEPSEASPYSLNEVFDQMLGDLEVPVCGGFVLGHTDEQLTWPLGVQAIMDANAYTLTVLEAGVTA